MPAGSLAVPEASGSRDDSNPSFAYIRICSDYSLSSRLAPLKKKQPTGTVKLPDGTVKKKHPAGTVKLPHGTLKKATCWHRQAA